MNNIAFLRCAGGEKRKEQASMTYRSQRKRLLAGIIVLLIAVPMVFIVWHFDDLKALGTSARSSSEEAEKSAHLTEQGDADTGKDTPKTATGEITDRKEAGERAPDFDRSENAQALAKEDAYEKAMSEQISKIYTLRDEYTAKLDALYASAKAAYSAIPAAERTQEAKTRISGEYISKANVLEGRCDAQVNAVLREMGSIAFAHDGDMTLVDEARETYESLKNAKKMWFMSQMTKEGEL